ncbi:MAG TPA: ABC transporter permease [Bryobacteraceae bacterium]|nr:ABC transporter permease [Bryobacteraceae bacterium]
MLRDLFLRLKSLFRRSAVERELEQELRFHLEQEIAKNLSRGLSESEATRRANLDLGGLEQMKEESRDARGVWFLETAVNDLRYAARILRKSPGFTTVAVLSLALGVGANTAIFQLINAIRLRTLPVNDPQNLAEIRIADMTDARGAQQRHYGLTYPLWEQIGKRQDVFSGAFAWADAEFNLSPQGEVRSVRGLWVSGRFFDVLGIRPFMGRLFTAGDDHRGCGVPGAVISYSFWQSEFGGSASVIGKKLTISDQQVSVLGVTPPGFFGVDVGHQFHVALPICSITRLSAFNALDSGTFWWLSVIGRLKPGITVEQASSQLASLSPGIFRTTLPANYPPVSVPGYLHMKLTAHSFATGLSDLRERYSYLLWVLLGIAGAVLLNACANLANLILARAGTREREIAVRLAIGGSTKRIIQQLLLESVLIAAGGAIAALFAAHWMSRGLLALLAANEGGVHVDLHPDWRVLVFTFVIASITCIIFGLTPALRAAQSQPVEALKSGSRSLTAGKATLGLRRALITAQVALSLVLLAESLLFVKTLRNLTHTEPGFRTHNLFVADLGFPRSNPQDLQVHAWQKALLNQVGSVPGVLAVADANTVPLAGTSSSNRMWIDGHDPRAAKDVHWSRISPGYFRTLGVGVLAGRDFTDHDGPATRKIAIVNEAFAKQVTLTSDPIGLTVRMEATPSTPETVFEIVGVVTNTKYLDVREAMGPIVYFPISQDPTPSLSDQLLIRSNLPLKNLLPPLRRAILEADANAHFEIYRFEDLIQESLGRERLMAALSMVFAILAALLSAVGLYGVITYIVTLRRTEIGIRIALGADRGRIFRMLFLESGTILLIGLLLGMLLLPAVAMLTGKMLFGVKPRDPVSLAAAVLLLLLVGFVSTFFPARRAALAGATAALREE